MGIKPSKKEVNRSKQIDFVSRLTFVKGLKDVPKERISASKESIKEKDKKKKKYKHWCMPSEPHGYIKCRHHDFL
jgi:hypothetical protein